jgi:hypothetical protein
MWTERFSLFVSRACADLMIPALPRSSRKQGETCLHDEEVNMSAKMLGSTLVIILALVAGLPRTAAAQSTTDIVIEWNRILQTTLGIPGALPPTIFFTRPYAVLHVAMFDALNSIDYRYQEYAIRADAGASASREVAAAQAGHDVMVAMFPNQAATFDAALAATVARFPGDAGVQGASVGAAAARAILTARADDGWNHSAQVYILPDLPGYWQPVPPQNVPAMLVHYQDVTPFVLSSRFQFLPERPPELTSERYARDFNEVKALGGTNSTVRTDEQTLIARVWAGVGYSTTAPGVWYNLGRDLAQARGLSGLDTARVFALLGVTMHDALLTSFTGKFVYGLWRPTTAIRAADRDGNPATDADPSFVSLIPTPPYPSYPGNMACIGSSSAAVYSVLWGTVTPPLSVTWTGAGQADVTRSYTGFRQMAEEEANSRIYAGIHYNFDHTASFGVCTALGQYVVTNVLRPR